MKHPTLKELIDDALAFYAIEFGMNVGNPDLRYVRRIENNIQRLRLFKSQVRKGQFKLVKIKH